MTNTCEGFSVTDFGVDAESMQCPLPTAHLLHYLPIHSPNGRYFTTRGASIDEGVRTKGVAMVAGSRPPQPHIFARHPATLLIGSIGYLLYISN